MNNNLFAQKFKGVLIAGLNSSQFDGDDYGGYDKPGLVFGSGISLPMSDKFFLNFEILYSQKGAKRQKDFYLLKLNYIETPFYLLYRLPGRFSFYTGLAPGVLLAQKTADLYGISEIDCFKLFDYEGLFGFGYQIIPQLELSSRLCYSIFNVLKEGCVGRGGFLEGANNLISTTLRYNF